MTAEDTNASTQEEAASVLIQVSEGEEIRSRHSSVASLCDEDDLRSIVRLAWQYQFAEDRYAFRKAMKDLELHIAGKARLTETSD